jgi:hypothetical protein
VVFIFPPSDILWAENGIDLCVCKHHALLARPHIYIRCASTSRESVTPEDGDGVLSVLKRPDRIRDICHYLKIDFSKLDGEGG